jgi:hypothetical protein
MCALIGGRNIQIEKTGVKCTTPDVGIAKLMWHLKNVACCLGHPGLWPTAYENYDNWNSIRKDDARKIIQLAKVFSPNNCIALGFMICSDEICGGFSNDFLKITDRRVTVAVTKAITIGGVNTKVSTIMAMTNRYRNESYPDWIQRAERMFS